MVRRSVSTHSLYFVIALAVLLLAVAAPALAADGVPLLPTTDPIAGDWQSQPQVSGPIVVFCAAPGGGDQTVYACNAGAVSRAPWSMRTLPGGGLLMGTQLQPRVLTRGDVVRIVWAQYDDSNELDLYLWEGSRSGIAAAGFPMKLVDHAYGRNAGDPSIGVTSVSLAPLVKAMDHVVVAWSDGSSINGPGGIGVVRWLDLTDDTDLDGTPDYKDSEFDPKTVGTQADPAAAATQWQPDVGPRGVFWLDARTHGDGVLETSIARLDLSESAPVAGLFHSEPAGSGFDAEWVRATGTGAAWLRSADYPGSGMEPVAKTVGGAMKVVTFLNNPWVFDVEGSAYAFTQGHGGTTSGDADVFFYTPSVGQTVGVCTLGSPDFDKYRAQDEPAISAASGGYRIVWADPRLSTGPMDEHMTLYQALVPTVTISANRTTVKLRRSVTFTAKVEPSHRDFAVKFQTGKRNSMTTAWGTSVWYTNVSTKKAKDLGSGSKTTWTWTPAKRGTYYWHVAFGGSKKYVAKAGYGANHVPNVSRWLKIVVK
jgi:hypothetical protein